MASARIVMLPTEEGDVPAQWFEEVFRGSVTECYDFLKVPRWMRRSRELSLANFLFDDQKAILHKDLTISIVQQTHGEDKCKNKYKIRFPRRSS